jgi:hypothetical protein
MAGYDMMSGGGYDEETLRRLMGGNTGIAGGYTAPNLQPDGSYQTPPPLSAPVPAPSPGTPPASSQTQSAAGTAVDYTRGLHDASTADADRAGGWSNYQGIAVRPGIDPGSVEAQLKALSDSVEQQYGYSGDLYNQSDLYDVLRHTGYDSPDTLQSMLDYFSSKYAHGVQNTPGAPGGPPGIGGGPTGAAPAQGFSQGFGGDPGMAGWGGEGGPGGFSFDSPNYAAQFTDPIQQALEQFAIQRAQQLETPPQGSGQNLLEQALRAISAQYQNGGFTPHEQEVLNTQAIEPVEQLRQARREQVIQSLSARGISPGSGVALQMLADVDRQFDGLITEQRRSIAAQSAQETQQRQLQALTMLGQLAGTEGTRLDNAFQYRSVPLNLADRSFQQAMALLGQQGNPASLYNPLLQLSQQQQGQSQGTSEALGYLAYLLSQMGGS